MPFTFEEKCFIKVLRQENGWGAKWICSEFRQKKWAVSSVNDLLRKINKTGSVERKVGSGRPWSIWTQRNISSANDLICSQEDNPGTSKSPHKIQKVTSVSRAFYHCVSSVIVVLWQKINLTNNHLIFQNKIGVILCENNPHLIWHIIQHTALASSYWTTKNKGYGFYWPTL